MQTKHEGKHFKMAFSMVTCSNDSQKRLLRSVKEVKKSKIIEKTYEKSRKKR